MRFSFDIFCGIHDVHYMKCFVEELEFLLFVICIEKFEFVGQLSAAPKNRGRSNKTKIQWSKRGYHMKSRGYPTTSLIYPIYFWKSGIISRETT